ncbi:MAG: hypothetical protein ACFFDI_22735 [Promethearchaeota archaeon]
MMIFVHVVQNVYNEEWAFDFDVLLKQSVFTIGAVGLLAFLSTWAGLFLLISTAVNSYSLTKKIQRGESPLKVLKYQILAGAVLVVVGFLVESYVGYYGSFGIFFRRGLAGFSWNMRLGNIFEFETLSAIGWSIIILGVVQVFLLPEGGVKKVKRNIIIFAVLTIAVIFLTPIVWDMAAFVYPNWPSGQRAWPPENFSDFFLRYLFAALSGTVEPLFPFLATAFIGAIIGTVLAQERPSKKLLSYGAIAGFVMIGMGVLFIFPPFDSYFGEFEFTFSRPGAAMYLIETGVQVLVTLLLLWLIEFRGSVRFTNWFKKYTTFFRRWGILALTIYSLQTLEMVPRYFLQMVFRWPTAYGGCTWQQTLVIAIVTLIFWDGVIRLWERVDFKGSFEWIIVYGTSFGRTTAPARLNVSQVLYEVEPVRFKDILATETETEQHNDPKGKNLEDDSATSAENPRKNPDN